VKGVKIFKQKKYDINYGLAKEKRILNNYIIPD